MAPYPGALAQEKSIVEVVPSGLEAELPAPHRAVTVGIKLHADGDLSLVYLGPGDDLVAAGVATAEAIGAARERWEPRNRIVSGDWRVAIRCTIAEAFTKPGVTTERLSAT